jgi:hypothetical protein
MPAERYSGSWAEANESLDHSVQATMSAHILIECRDFGLRQINDGD